MSRHDSCFLLRWPERKPLEGAYTYLYLLPTVLFVRFPPILLNPAIAFGNPVCTVTVSHAVIKSAYVGSAVERTAHFCIPPCITIINPHAFRMIECQICTNVFNSGITRAHTFACGEPDRSFWGVFLYSIRCFLSLL